MSQFAVWPARGDSVSAITLAQEMAALAKATVAPPPFPDDAARGTGQPVIVIPGFLAPDMSTARLRDFLAHQGFAPTSWNGGINLGPMPRVLDALEQQVKDAAAAGRPVALVGVSLGGTTAREMAKRCPEAVARVITLVSPIHLPVITPLAPLAAAAAVLWDAQARETIKTIAAPPPVPLTALVSPDDGVIDWRAALPDAADGVEVVHISGPHMTVCSNPQVQRIVARVLAS